jgi:hypothetical protein
VCAARHYTETQLRARLKGKRVLVLGDSHGRIFYSWLHRKLNGRRVAEEWGLATCLVCPSVWGRYAVDMARQLGSDGVGSRPFQLPCCSPVLLSAGTFTANPDDFAKFYHNHSWEGVAGTGATAASPAAADLHLAFHWHSTLPPLVADIREM